MAPKELGSLKVEGIILSGRPYEAQRQSALVAVARGIVSKGAM